MAKAVRMMVAAAGAALLGASPAMADPGWGYRAYAGERPYDTEARLEREFRQLVWQFQRADRAGRIDRAEGRRIEARLAEIDRLGNRYARDGFNRGERQRLERLIREARQALHYAARDRNWRDARYDRW